MLCLPMQLQSSSKYSMPTPQSTYIQRTEQCLASSEQLTPHPLSTQRVCPLPAPKAWGTVHTRRAVRGWGSIFRKTPDIGLASYSITPLRPTQTSLSICRGEKFLSVHAEKMGTMKLRVFICGWEMQQLPGIVLQRQKRPRQQEEVLPASGSQLPTDRQEIQIRDVQ